MEVDNVLEKLFYLLIESLVAQIKQLESSGPYQEKRKHIADTLAMAYYLKELLNTTEEGLIEKIESLCEQTIAETAGIKDFITAINVRTGNQETELVGLQKIAAENHQRMVKHVGRKETEMEAALLREFSKMKNSVDGLILRIGSLRS